MAWSFGDSFDLYTAVTDAATGYWDTTGSAGQFTFTAGRFAGSQAIANSSNVAYLTKSSAVNDAAHHLVVAFRQTAAISGSTLGMYLQLLDGTTAQCSVVFRSDGAILLASGAANGTVLATYTGAFPVTNTWYAFEIEVVINNTTGSFKVRKNGNSVDDFSASSLDTQNSANAYANKLTVGMQATVNNHNLDDLFWRSDASSVAWMGDIRCYTRMPASDASVQFSRSPATNLQTPFPTLTTPQSTLNSSTAFYTPITAAYDGAVGTVVINLNAGFTGNLKCSLFNGPSTGPTTILGSATTITNPVTGNNTFTFPTPPSVVKNTSYWIGFSADGTYANAYWTQSAGAVGKSSTTTYAAFPVASPTGLNINQPIVCSWNITTGSNATVVNEPQQDALTSYVYDSTPGHADLYNIATIGSTPATVIAVTTRAYMQKSDAGTRTAAVNLKSGSTTVASPTVTLTTSGWQWAWRTDTVDPATSAAWTAAAVDSAQVGPTVIA